MMFTRLLLDRLRAAGASSQLAWAVTLVAVATLSQGCVATSGQSPTTSSQVTRAVALATPVRVQPTATPVRAQPSATPVATVRQVLTSAPTVAAQAKSAAAAKKTLVDAGDYFFNPDPLSVPVGAAVTWRNVGAEAHDVVARNGSFSSSTMVPGEQFTFTFTKAGHYSYVCTFHEGDGMFAEIDVK